MYAARSRLGWLRWLHGWLLATTSAGVTTRPSNSLHNTITSALRGIARLIRPISAMIAARPNIFIKKSQGKISVGGPESGMLFLLQLPLGVGDGGDRGRASLTTDSEAPDSRSGAKSE